MTTLFHSLTEKDKTDAVERLIVESTPRDDYFLLIVLSILMATFGLLVNSASVIIGSMLIAPLLSPILSISMGIVMADRRLIMRSVKTVGKSIGFAVLAAAVAALFLSEQAGLGPELNAEINARIEPNLIAALIALVAGLAASFALIKPHLNATLPGVAISVSLIPPLGVTGIGIARFNWTMIANSLILFAANAACVIFASVIIFSLMRLVTKHSVAKKVVEKEDNKLKKEEGEAAKEAAKEEGAA